MSDGNEKLYNFKKRSDEAGQDRFGPSLTVQSDAVDADINTIVRRYGITGKLPDNFRLPAYEDYEDVFDFHSAQQALANGEQEFMRLPGEIRARFDHDAGAFLTFAANPENFDHLVDMGLATRREPEAAPDPIPVIISPPPSPPAGSTPATPA